MRGISANTVRTADFESINLKYYERDFKLFSVSSASSVWELIQIFVEFYILIAVINLFMISD